MEKAEDDSLFPPLSLLLQHPQPLWCCQSHRAHSSREGREATASFTSFAGEVETALPCKQNNPMKVYKQNNSGLPKQNRKLSSSFHRKWGCFPVPCFVHPRNIITWKPLCFNDNKLWLAGSSVHSSCLSLTRGLQPPVTTLIHPCLCGVSHRCGLKGPGLCCLRYLSSGLGCPCAVKDTVRCWSLPCSHRCQSQAAISGIK